eukprot:7382222-Prymnesium_polylepis.1
MYDGRKRSARGDLRVDVQRWPIAQRKERALGSTHKARAERSETGEHPRRSANSPSTAGARRAPRRT